MLICNLLTYPFQYTSLQKTDWLVTVTVQKIDKSWWYNACNKCLRTARPFRDSFRCAEPRCGAVGAPIPRSATRFYLCPLSVDIWLYSNSNVFFKIRPASTRRYKLCIVAGDETGDTDFVIFGRIAQRLIRKPVDTLVADNPTGFIPDEITRLLEKVFVWNVSFTENTIATGIVSFQVNSVVAQLDGGGALSMTPTGSQSSSLMLSKCSSSSLQDAPLQSTTSALPFPAAASEGSRASSAAPIKMPPLIAKAPPTPQSRNTAAEEEVDYACSFQYRLFSYVLIETDKNTCSTSLLYV